MPLTVTSNANTPNQLDEPENATFNDQDAGRIDQFCATVDPLHGAQPDARGHQLPEPASQVTATERPQNIAPPPLVLRGPAHDWAQRITQIVARAAKEAWIHRDDVAQHCIAAVCNFLWIHAPNHGIAAGHIERAFSTGALYRASFYHDLAPYSEPNSEEDGLAAQWWARTTQQALRNLMTHAKYADNAPARRDCSAAMLTAMMQTYLPALQRSHAYWHVQACLAEWTVPAVCTSAFYRGVNEPLEEDALWAELQGYPLLRQPLLFQQADADNGIPCMGGLEVQTAARFRQGMADVYFKALRSGQDWRLRLVGTVHSLQQIWTPNHVMSAATIDREVERFSRLPTGGCLFLRPETYRGKVRPFKQLDSNETWWSYKLGNIVENALQSPGLVCPSAGLRRRAVENLKAFVARHWPEKQASDDYWNHQVWLLQNAPGLASLRYSFCMGATGIAENDDFALSLRKPSIEAELLAKLKAQVDPLWFDAQYYMNHVHPGRFQDISEASAFYFRYGLPSQGDPGSPHFNPRAYLRDDLAQAFGPYGFTAALDHWLHFRHIEQRPCGSMTPPNSFLAHQVTAYPEVESDHQLLMAHAVPPSVLGTATLVVAHTRDTPTNQVEVELLYDEHAYRRSRPTFLTDLRTDQEWTLSVDGAALEPMTLMAFGRATQDKVCARRLVGTDSFYKTIGTYEIAGIGQGDELFLTPFLGGRESDLLVARQGVHNGQRHLSVQVLSGQSQFSNTVFETLSPVCSVPETTRLHLVAPPNRNVSKRCSNPRPNIGVIFDDETSLNLKIYAAQSNYGTTVYETTLPFRIHAHEHFSFAIGYAGFKAALAAVKLSGCDSGRTEVHLIDVGSHFGGYAIG